MGAARDGMKAVFRGMKEQTQTQAKEQKNEQLKVISGGDKMDTKNTVAKTADAKEPTKVDIKEVAELSNYIFSGEVQKDLGLALEGAEVVRLEKLIKYIVSHNQSFKEALEGAFDVAQIKLVEAYLWEGHGYFTNTRELYAAGYEEDNPPKKEVIWISKAGKKVKDATPEEVKKFKEDKATAEKANKDATDAKAS